MNLFRLFDFSIALVFSETRSALRTRFSHNHNNNNIIMTFQFNMARRKKQRDSQKESATKTKKQKNSSISPKKKLKKIKQVVCSSFTNKYSFASLLAQSSKEGRRAKKREQSAPNLWHMLLGLGLGYRRHLSDGLGFRIYDSETKTKNEKLRYSGVVLLFHRHITRFS